MSSPATLLATPLTPERKYPQFQQDEIFGLQDAFRKLDVDDKGYIDEATAIKATQASERQPYDVVRQALKEVELDSSRRVELDDYVGVRVSLIPSTNVKLKIFVARSESPGLLACSKARLHRADNPKSRWRGITTNGWRTYI